VRLFSQDTKVQALKRAPLFEGLSKKELVELARVTEDLEIGAGEVLCKEGETGQEFFVIVEGETDVTTSKGKHVAARGGGDFVGEIALLEETTRTATVTAKTPLRVFVLTRQDFRHLVRENPSVEQKVMRALARRVVELSGDPTMA
jgi:CRP/FNR family transcriptional regulator, cyclic AMP receptor protein